MAVFASANPSPPISRRLRCCVLRRYENVFIELLAEEKNDYPAAHADKDQHISVSDGGANGLRPSSLHDRTNGWKVFNSSSAMNSMKTSALR